MSKYLEKVRQAEDEVAAELVEAAFADFTADERQMAAILLGRAQASDRIAVALSAEVIRFLEHFEETKSYRALGHSDFVTFLANSGLHGVTKHKYYERKKVLELEGDPVFDALSLAGVPISLRKQLEPGDVTIDGNTIVIKAETDEEDIVIDKDNSIAVVQTIRNLAAARRQDRRQIEAVREKLDAVEAKYDEKVRSLYEENDRIKAAKIADIASNPHMIARVELGLAFTRLAEAASKLSAIEKEQFRDSVLQDVAEWRLALASGYATDSSKASAPAPVAIVGDGLDEALENYLDSVDLDNVADDNDGDLAAAL